MKRTVRLVVLGALLHSGAQAAGQDTVPEPSLNAARHTQAARPAAKKQKAVRSKKSKAVRVRKVKAKSRLGTENATPQAVDKQDAVTPTESIEQTIQLKGVRG